MIAECMTILKNELDNYLDSIQEKDFECILGNFALLGSEEGELNDKVVQTLVRIEEESTLKNVPNDKIVGGRSFKANPLINLNLYVLFVSHYSGNYIKSLEGLSEVIKFFQGKYHFNAQNSDLTEVDSLTNDFKLWLNIHTPTFEESNHLWSMLGGKQYPSVMYKVKMIAEERQAVQSSAPLITGIEGELNQI